MKHKPALYALERLHAELGGQLKENRQQAVNVLRRMKQVEAVLRMLDPDFNILGIAPRRRYKRVAPFEKGKGFKAITDVLRASTEPLTSGEIAERIFEQAGDPEPSREAVRGMVPTVHSALRRHQGTAVEVVGEGMPARWRLIEHTS
jgi:hypothetical protein